MTNAATPVEGSTEPLPEANDRRPSLIRRWTGRVAGALATLLLLLTVGGFLGEFHWLLDLMNEWRMQYALLGLIPAAILLIARAWRWLAVAAAVVVLNGWVVAPFLVGGGPATAGDGKRDLRVMTLNVHFSTTDYESTLRLLREQRPDLVVLSEVDPAWLDRLRGMDAGYDIHDTPTQGTQEKFGLALLTRVPLESVRFETFGDKWSPSIIARLSLDGRPATVIGTHPPAPIGAKTWENRNEHLAELAQFVAGLDTPTLVAGDLNMTMWSPHYDRLTETANLRNARDGHGLLPTFPATKLGVGFAWPLRIPLDHVLVTSEWSVLDCNTAPGVGSDHLPLTVDVTLRDAAE